MFIDTLIVAQKRILRFIDFGSAYCAAPQTVDIGAPSCYNADGYKTDRCRGVSSG